MTSTQRFFNDGGLQHGWLSFRWALLLENWYTKLHKVAYTGLTLLLYVQNWDGKSLQGSIP